jgi:hypothetical protein
MQRPKICARAGSATRLNAGSHPTGGCDLTATAGDETLEVADLNGDASDRLAIGAA